MGMHVGGRIFGDFCFKILISSLGVGEGQEKCTQTLKFNLRKIKNNPKIEVMFFVIEITILI